MSTDTQRASQFSLDVEDWARAACDAARGTASRDGQSGACEAECPVAAIYLDDDVPAEHRDDIEHNAKFFRR